MKKNNDYNPFQTLLDEDISIIIELLEREIRLTTDSINRCRKGGKYWTEMTHHCEKLSQTLDRTLNLKLRDFF